MMSRPRAHYDRRPVAITLAFVAEPIPYRIRRSRRVSRVRVAVDLDRGVEVVLPMRTPERAAAAAVAELRPWIERRLEEVAALRSRLAERVGWVPYLDERLTLVEQAGRTRVHRQGQQLLVPEAAEDRRAGLERWYRRAARDEVAGRLDRATAAAGLTYAGLSIRGQRTRWASCAADGSMSFNWRLLLAPERVLDYVVWHEVSHLEVADHSPRFWALVERRCPDWREPAAWLRENGRDLVL
jgi:predicted metal-dependent hydrolase